MTAANVQIKSLTLTTTAVKDGGFIEIPIEAIVDGEVVIVDTKAIPIIPQKE